MHYAHVGVGLSTRNAMAFSVFDDSGSSRLMPGVSRVLRTQSSDRSWCELAVAPTVYIAGLRVQWITRRLHTVLALQTTVFGGLVQRRRAELVPPFDGETAHRDAPW